MSAIAITMDARRAETKPGLAECDRGAVMLTGLFMSVFLIGALWFIIGIGDTLVYRDMMQEAVDHGAFSDAALNAKGMNLIALINLVMLAATVLYLGLGLLTDVAGAAFSICVASIYCIPEAPDVYEAWTTMYDVWKGYYTGYKFVLDDILYPAETAVGYVYPLAGTAAAYKVGGKYDTDSVRRGGPTVLAMSTAMVPGGALRALPGGSGTKKKTLLPLEPKSHDFLCDEIFYKMGTAVSNFIGGGGKAINKVASVIGGIMKYRYCNKDAMAGGFLFWLEDPEWYIPWPESGRGPGAENEWWGKDGFYIVYAGASNGNMWFQTYSIAISTPMHDRSDAKVQMAGQKKGGWNGQNVKQESGTYLAQAEFYFDCKDKWSDNNCNYKENAAFSINWRARLKRLDQPGIIGALVGDMLNSLENGNPTSALGKGGGLVDVLTDKISEFLESGIISKSLIKSVLDDIQDKVNEVIGNFAGGFDPSVPGIYH